MLIALTVRSNAAPAADPIAEAVRYANILTGVDPDTQLATHAPDDPDDQLTGTSSDDDDDDDDDIDDNADAGASSPSPNNVRRSPRASDPRASDPRASDPRASDARGDGSAEARKGDAPDLGEAAAAMPSSDPHGDGSREPRERHAADFREAAAAMPGEDGEQDPTLGAASSELAEHAAELAVTDDDPARSAVVTSDDAGFAGSSAGAVESYEARMRSRRSWMLGRVDVGLAWRRHLSEPMHAAAHVGDEVWLLAAWRR